MLELADNCLTFITWNPTRGVWEVKVNGPSEGPYRNLGDSDIVGSINVTGSGVDEIYNSVAVTFKNRDLNGNPDEVISSIAANKRYEKELDNQMNLNYRLVNNSVQAEYLGNIELKQSRLDVIVEFALDWRHIDIQAGEIVTITNDQYGWDKKQFRIVTVDENDDDDGAVILKVTALEHDNDVYDDSGLRFYERPYWPGIIPKATNTYIATNESEARGVDIADALATDAGRAAITGAGIPIFETANITWSTATVQGVYGAGTGVGGARQLSTQLAQFALGNDVYSDDIRTQTDSLQASWTTVAAIKSMDVDFNGPQGNVSYTINGRQGVFNAGIPTQTYLFYSNSPNGPWIQQQNKYMEWSSYITKFTVSQINLAPVYWLFLAGNLVTYDLSETADIIVNIDSVNSVFPAADGSGADITVKFFLN